MWLSLHRIEPHGESMAEIEIVKIVKNDDEQIILGHAGFIKTAEDLYECMVGAVPGIKFGIAFAEASGPGLIRTEGNDGPLESSAGKNMQKIAAGHSFLIMFKGAFPINIANAIKQVPEVARIFCATANPVEVLVVETRQGRGIVGVVDGSDSKGVEKQADRAARRKFLRDIGYKK